MKLDYLAPWRPRRRDWNRAAAHHLLLRAGFGAAPGEARALVELGFAKAQAEVLGRDQHDLRMEAGVQSILATGKIDKLAAWWMSLILGGGAPLRERVTLMWHNHFATSMAKVEDHRMMHDQVQLFRTLGMGDFRELLHAIARDPAMLRWLDGDKNRAGHPNENFAREVMELFALGIGNYTEQDVLEAARAFSGWRASGNSFSLRRVDHDPGQKTLLGQTGAWGTQEAIKILLASPHCARHIARRLLEEFVHPKPQEAWVAETAALLVREDWQIERTVHIILGSKLFYSATVRRSRIAGPVELMAAAARSLGVHGRPALLVERCGQMGQALFYPKSVKGWDGMRTWINAGTWIARHNALLELSESAGEAEAREAAGWLEHLLPELVAGEFEERLQATLKALPAPPTEPGKLAALIFTSPEYHLV